jgi:cytochrome P450
MATEQRDDQWMASELASTERQRNPYPWFREMRTQGPIRYDEKRDAYDVFHYDEIVTLATDWERFTRDGTSFIDGAMMDRGPPEHTELRGMAEASFRPGNLREYRPEFERQADALLDEALADSGRLNFIEEIAKPLPIMIIAQMLGVPTDKLDTFREWSTALAEAPAQPTAEARQATERRKLDALDQVTDFFERELRAREDDPRDDLITTMLQAEAASDTITRQQTIANCAMLLIAGNITTTTYIANALWTYVEEDVVSDIQDGTLDIETANQELLRYRSPVIAIKRFATEDTEIAGTPIEEGSMIVGYIPSANRDERVFEHPDEFRPGRDRPKEPIPFGKGIHYCLGAPLANMEAEIMLSKFFERVEDVSLVDDLIDPFFSSEIYGAVDLPITVTT